MKILYSFVVSSTLTSSGVVSGFPESNINDLDPNKRAKLSGYTGDVWIVLDFLTAQSLDSCFLNRCNFPQCKIQGNASNSWSSPSFDLTCNLVKDGAQNRKGWFNVTGFNYRYMRILISGGQTLDNSETTPAIGNLILGTAVTMPIVAQISPRLVQRFNRFESDEGTLVKSKKGLARHSISISIGDKYSPIRDFFKGWSIAVFFADLGSVADSWLVWPPDDWVPSVKNIHDSQLSTVLEERP